MELHNTLPFEIDFFHLAHFSGDTFRLLCASINTLLCFLLCSIPWH